MKWYVGTSGWSYRHWLGKFYPEDMQPSQWLSHYAKNFNTVEINMTFYRIPFKNVVRSWVEKTPDNFKFSVKINRKITHLQKFENVDEILIKFYDAIHLLSPKLYFFLFQIPPSLKYSERKLEQILEVVRFFRNKWLDVKIAMEFRHTSWFNSDVREFTILHNISVVYSDSGNRFPEVFWPNETMYIRMHGPGTLYSSKYASEQLNQLVWKILQSEEIKEVAIYFNNDYNCYAVENAKELISIVKKGDSEWVISY
jgi:uncharacterized protein YecE (DUF72 family)